MIKRFRMIAGPNGSGKSTLIGWLHDDYSVNFYTLLNADDILAHLLKTGAYSPKFPVSKEDLVRYAEATDYGEDVKSIFRGESVAVETDCVRFKREAINSYTVALFTNFLQECCLRRGESFSQETVFSHPSKVEAIRRAFELGYRTYLYFIATASPEISKCRVANRHARGGHDVPSDKIDSRYFRSIGQLKAALPYLSRAYAFDNSGSEMIFLGEYEQGAGWQFAKSVDELPRWFVDAL